MEDGQSKVYSFPIVGMKYELLVYYGRFIGKAIAESNNQYDKNAVGIYIRDMRQGYIPKSDNKEISNIIEKHYDGEIDCYGYLSEEEDQGRVYVPVIIEKNSKKITKRIIDLIKIDNYLDGELKDGKIKFYDLLDVVEYWLKLNSKLGEYSEYAYTIAKVPDKLILQKAKQFKEQGKDKKYKKVMKYNRIVEFIGMEEFDSL